MFKIGEFSRLSNTSVRMLRHYGKIGLLMPDYIDAESDYRYYHASQLAEVNKIKELQSLGFSLAIIKEMLTTHPTIPLDHYFNLRQQEVTEELEQLKRQQQLVDSAMAIIQQKSQLSHYHVIEKTMPKRSVMSVRQIIETYADEQRLWEILRTEAHTLNVQLTSPALGLTLYHGDEYQEQQIDTEVQSTVIGDYSGTETVTFQTVPETLVASVTFNGSYEQMPAVAEAVASWMEVNQYQLAGPMFNIFHVSPSESPSPEEWVTEACYQIAKRKDDDLWHDQKQKKSY